MAAIRSLIRCNKRLLTLEKQSLLCGGCRKSQSFQDYGRQCYGSLATAEQITHRAQYGGRHTVSLLPGDGIGPELLGHVQEVYRYAGAPIDFEVVEINSETKSPEFMTNALLSVKRNGVALKGNIETKDLDLNTPSMNVALRTNLDLYANVIWCKSIPGVRTRHKDIDVILIRENTEGEYSNLEHENVSGVIESLKIITAEKSTRIAKYAFDYAVKHGRNKVTAVHKANIMKLGDGLFLECCRKVSESYPQIEFSNMIIDNCSMQFIQRVERPGGSDMKSYVP